MRELHEVTPSPSTREDILVHGLAEIAAVAPGSHSDPCYEGWRELKEYAQRILDAADDAGSTSQLVAALRAMRDLRPDTDSYTRDAVIAQADAALAAASRQST